MVFGVVLSIAALGGGYWLWRDGDPAWRTAPVSYTHLDVYKRQLLSFAEVIDKLGVSGQSSLGVQQILSLIHIFECDRPPRHGALRRLVR